MSHVTLNMIVRNEAHVITRALDSAKDVVDSVTIVDTGSTDGTQDIVLDWLRKNDFPAVIYEEPWVDFAHNRTQALEYAEASGADCAVILDADDTLRPDPGFTWPVFHKDAYALPVEYNGFFFARVNVLRLGAGWCYRGVLHEFPALRLGGQYERGEIPTLRYVVNGGGGRSADPDKYAKDAMVLETALETETDAFLRCRYQFYLAQSYRDSLQLQKAGKAYMARAEMGGWEEEVYISKLELAKVFERLCGDPEDVTALYLDAYTYRPMRAEALWHLIRYRDKNKLPVRQSMRDLLKKIPTPTDTLFLERRCYG